jgi:hypothetical protein
MRIVLIMLLVPLTLGAQEQNNDGRFVLEDWIPEPGPFSWGVYTGANAVWWGVDYAEESVWNETLDSVNRDPFFLFKATVDLDNILGYLDWNFSYIADSPQRPPQLHRRLCHHGTRERQHRLPLPAGDFPLSLSDQTPRQA